MRVKRKFLLLTHESPKKICLNYFSVRFLLLCFLTEILYQRKQLHVWHWCSSEFCANHSFRFLSLYPSLVLKQGNERIKYCGMEDTALNRSRREGKEPKMEPWPANLERHVQQQPEGPLCNSDAGVGSSSNWERNSSNKKFDVFISCRGVDDLCDWLCHVLRDSGLNVFLGNEELQSGERVSEDILEAISCSRVYVCIMSRYARSAYSLNELEMVLDLIQHYDIKPREFRSVPQCFEMLVHKGRISYDEWRAAGSMLMKTTRFEGPASFCMTDIVYSICMSLGVAVPDFSRVPQRRALDEAVPPFARLVGRQEQLSSIIHDILAYGQNGLGVTSVEISGIGGIGKTAFAKELYDQICNHYKLSCFMEDARGLVEKHGINEVRAELFGKLFNYGSLGYFTIKTKKLLKDRLHNAEILVVIDNIDSTIPLSTIFVEDVSLGPKSTIIVTSREDGVLKHDLRVANYCKNLMSVKLSNLDLHTSKELFLQYAFGGIDNVNNEFDKIINKMVEKCHGVPLALALLGRQVYGREIYVWENLDDSINDALTPDLQKILAVSYDNLNTELEKCLFLDVATFFRWEKVDCLLKLRQSNHEDGESEFLYALDVLKKKLLIEVKEGGFLYMHDILVKLGRSIVRNESVWPGLYSRMWCPDDVKQILSKQILSDCSHADVMDIYKTEIKKVRTLSLHGTDASSPVVDMDEDMDDASSPVVDMDEDMDEDRDRRPWPADAFSEMSSLEVLFLDGNCIEGDLSKLPRRLKWLRWTNFPYQSMPPICLNSVRILELSGSPLTRSLNPKLPTNLQGLISRICRRGRPDCLSKLTQYLTPNANSLFNQLLTNARLSRGHPESLAKNLQVISVPLMLYLFLLTTPGPWQRFLPH